MHWPRLLAIVVILGASLLPHTANAHTSTIVITMTENGFEPREITVDENTTINFSNKDTVDRWPASNVHPTHNIYPEFDPAAPIKPGDFWLFKPTRVGTWKYHDHLLPHQRGTITVIAEAGHSPAESPGWRAKIKQTWYSFWQLVFRPFQQLKPARAFTPLPAQDFQALDEQLQYKYLTEISEQQDISAAWAFVKSTYTNDSGAAAGGRSHDLAHFVGELIYKEQGLGGLGLCDTTFAFGCYHGFTEGAFTENLDPLPAVAEACLTLGPASSGPWASCIHGIGHGVATFFDAVELENALATCDTVPGAAYCHDGVFMEFSFSAPPNFYKTADPLFPCSELPETYQLACGRNQPGIMRSRLHLSETAIAGQCDAISPEFTTSCIDALGFAIASASPSDPAAITAGCQIFSDHRHQAQCAAAAAGELVFQNYPNWQTNAPAVCSFLAPDFQPACTERVAQTARNYQRQ